MDSPVRQFMTVPSVEDFATSQNWLFVAEVWNMVWWGQIKNRIIWNRQDTYRRIFHLSGGTIRLIFSALVI